MVLLQVDGKGKSDTDLPGSHAYKSSDPPEQNITAIHTHRVSQ